jgi:hypothetical protein
MLYRFLLMDLAIGRTTAFGKDAIIPDDDRPVAFGDPEAAERFEVLFAGDESTGAILSNRPAEAIAIDNQVTTLVEVTLDEHGQDNRPLWLGLVGNAEVRRGALPRGQGLITVALGRA